MFELRKMEMLPFAFSEKLWHALVDYVTVHADGRLAFAFKKGRELIEEW